MVEIKKFPDDPLKVSKRGRFSLQSERPIKDPYTYGKKPDPSSQHNILPLTHTHKKAPDGRQIVDPTTYYKRQTENGGTGPTTP